MDSTVVMPLTAQVTRLNGKKDSSSAIMLIKFNEDGKIIGKKGKTINAIRTLLMSVASRNGLRVNLEILEDENGSRRVVEE